MISFIVIAKNEEKYLRKCFESIYLTVKQNSILNYEIIYIDSNSSDKSLQIAKSYDHIRKFKILIGENAAVARNLGAEKAKGEILFFIDGDMEIIPEFYKVAFDAKGNLKHPFVTGIFEYLIYDQYDNFIRKKLWPPKRPNKMRFKSIMPNGSFLIKKSIWVSVSGMDTRLFKSEDMDFLFRLRKRKIALIRYNNVIAKHHTIDYANPKRMWRELSSFKTITGRAIAYRKNVLVLGMITLFIRWEYSLIVLVSSILLVLAISSWLPSFVYIFVLFMRSAARSHYRLFHWFQLFFYFALRDVFMFFTLLFSYPPIVNWEYEEVN